MGAILLVYTNAPRIAWERGVVPVPPAASVALLGLLSLMLLFRRGRAALFVHAPVWIWGIGYLSLVGMSYLLGSQTDLATSALAAAGLGVLTMLVFLVIFADAGALAAASGALVGVTLFAVALNLFEVFRPGTFSLFVGRAAGFYLNPNIASSAIVYGLILGINAIAPRHRPWYVFATGAGVLATLSRSGLLCWTLAVGLLWFSGIVRLSWRMWVVAIVIGVLGLAAVPRGVLSLAWDFVALSSGSQFSRLGFDGSGAVFGSTSVTERVEVARAAVEMFADHPFLGGGPGATVEWAHRQSTHNMYLRFLAELGILGLFVYPGLLLAAVWRTPHRLRSRAATFGVVWLTYGLFTHNEFENRHGLVAVAFLAALVLVERSCAAPVRVQQRDGSRIDSTGMQVAPCASAS